MYDDKGSMHMLDSFKTWKTVFYRGDVKGRLTKNKTVSNVTFNRKGYADERCKCKTKNRAYECYFQDHQSGDE